MSKKTKIILLSIIAVLIVVVLSVGITTAFMKPIKQGGNITEVSLSSCAKIKLEGSNSITLSNSYPMSRNKGLQTTPYTFTVTSYCDTYVGFNLYLATLSTNTLPASNIHYIITEKDSKEALAEGTLESTLDAVSEFSDAEKTELNTGLGGAYGNIYKIYNNSVPYKGSSTYDLYLFVDENVTEYQSTTFAAGVAIKSYEREKEVYLADYVKSLYAGTQGNNNIYYHDGSIKDSDGNVIDAEDNSYRYSGTNNDVNNFVCFDGSDCNDEKNLYRIVGVYENTKVKLLKYEYATTDEVGKDNNAGTFSKSDYPNYDGTLETIPKFSWAASASSTVAMLSNYRAIFYVPDRGCDDTGLSKTSLVNDNLNNNYLSSLTDNIKSKIIQNRFKYYVRQIPFNGSKQAYIYEYGSSSPDTHYDEKIGILNSNEYMFSFSKDFWLTNSNNIEGPNSWIFRGIPEYLNSQATTDTLQTGYISNDGSIRAGYSCQESTNSLSSLAIRPTFYAQDIKLLSGNGTKQNPYIIE